MNNKIMTVLRIFLLASMVLTVSFTFYQSSKSKEKSTETSQKFEEIIEPILPSDTPTGAYVQDNIRKIAHFIEFFALGVEIALYVLIFERRWKYVAFSFGVGPVIALLDETIQIFFDRGPAISDVWLDIAGCYSALLITYLIGALLKRLYSFFHSESGGDV